MFGQLGAFKKRGYDQYHTTTNTTAAALKKALA